MIVFECFTEVEDIIFDESDLFGKILKNFLLLMYVLIYARIVRFSHYFRLLPRFIILDFGVVFVDGNQNDCEQHY